MRCTVAFLIVLAGSTGAGAAGCGSKAPPPPAQAALGADGARREARAVIDEVYRALRSGDSDDLLSLMSDDVVVLGPRTGDLQRSRAEVVIALREVIDSRRKTRFASAGVRVGIGPGGRSAYAVDRLRLGNQAALATALLDGQGSIWRITAVSVQLPVAPAAARKALAGGALGAPAATAQPPLLQAEAATQTAAKALTVGLATPTSWLAALGDDPDGALLTSDGTLASGPRAVDRAVKRFADVTLRPTSPISGVTSSDGQLALVTCLASRQYKDEPPRPVRLTAVFRRTSGTTAASAQWQLAVFQEAHAIAGKAR
jgi:ketosteroid isomerase-like protein